LLGVSLSPAQVTLLKSTYGLPLRKEELELFRQCTGREKYPGHPFGEVTVIAGARAGKDSRIAAPVAVYEAIFGGHEWHLGKGERAIIPIVAQDQRATRIAFGICEGLSQPITVIGGDGGGSFEHGDFAK